MNDLQKLIKLRGLTVGEVATRIGFGYHNTQKIIKGCTVKRSDGSFHVRSNPEIEQAIADLLGITHEQAWGDESCKTLKRLIRQELQAVKRRIHREISAKAKAQGAALEREFLCD